MIPLCKACGAAQDRPCTDEKCPERPQRARDFRFVLNSYKSWQTGRPPDYRAEQFGFENPPPDDWVEILTAGENE